MSLQPPTSTMVLLAGLLAQQLGLKQGPNGQVFLFNQKWKIPSNDAGMFLVLSRIGMKEISSNLGYENDVTTLNEVRTVRFRETYSINLFSFDASAINATPLLAMALNSTASEQLCEANGMKIFSVSPSVVDTSSLEATAMLNRTTRTVQIIRGYTATSPAQFYDRFPNGIEVFNDSGKSSPIEIPIPTALPATIAA